VTAYFVVLCVSVKWRGWLTVHTSTSDTSVRYTLHLIEVVERKH
jgi:hypothetical protein